MIAGTFSCNESSKPASEAIAIDNQKEEQVGESAGEKRFTNRIDDQYIDTKYEYDYSTGGRILIQNSFPRGGHKYTDPSGKDYTYAIFWTQLTNESGYPLDLELEFSGDSLELPNSPDTYFKIFLTSEPMTPDKVPLFNYGLNSLQLSLDSGLGKPSSLKKTVDSKESFIFYVVTASNRGIDGVVRAGFSLEEQNVIFTFNKTKIKCGHIKFKN